MAESLAQERDSTSFSIELLTKKLWAGIFPDMTYDELLSLREKLRKIPELNRSPMEHYENREEKIARLYKQFPVFWKFL